jgi:hypothetical protein
LRAGFATITQDHTDVFKVLIGQIREDIAVDPVLGKALGILGHAELGEPVRNLLHCGAPSHAAGRRYPIEGL